MLYFLVILIPFAAFMIHLTRQNNRLRKIYLEITKDLLSIAQHQGSHNLLNLQMLTSDKIITPFSIKKLEKVLHAVEEASGKKKSPTVANRFAHRIQKLQQMKTYVEQLKNYLESQQKQTVTKVG
ncbi:MAG: hypothetical protein NZ521_00220 [Flammeovirgaceae bacterium]|nr:hypothetical protein [Flammeovirgaceae bacterium]MDW8286478.1 hypothetical protein [Flammeovirgaceae bacterium]